MSSNPIDPAVLARRRAEPHWLYRMYNSSGELLYVGQTCRPVARFHLWHSAVRRSYRSAWFEQVRRVDWRRYPNWHAVVAAEKKAIEVEAPRYNRQHQPGLVAA